MNQELGVCSGSTAEVLFDSIQPIESYQNLDVNSWIQESLTDSEWSTSGNWYKWDGLVTNSTIARLTHQISISNHLSDVVHGVVPTYQQPIIKP